MNTLAYTLRCPRRGVLMINDAACRRRKQRPQRDVAHDIKLALADCRACSGPEVLAEPIPIEQSRLAGSGPGKPSIGGTPPEVSGPAPATNRRQTMAAKKPARERRPVREPSIKPAQMRPFVLVLRGRVNALRQTLPHSPSAEAEGVVAVLDIMGEMGLLPGWSEADG